MTVFIVADPFNLASAFNMDNSICLSINFRIGNASNGRLPFLYQREYFQREFTLPF